MLTVCDLSTTQSKVNRASDQGRQRCAFLETDFDLVRRANTHEKRRTKTCYPSVCRAGVDRCRDSTAPSPRAVLYRQKGTRFEASYRKSLRGCSTAWTCRTCRRCGTRTVRNTM